MIIGKHAPQMFGAKRKGQKVVIKYPESNYTVSGNATFIGSGRFSNAFRLPGLSFTRCVVIYTFWEDFSKSILVHARNEAQSHLKYLPTISRISSWDYKGKFCNVYRARYYPPLPKKLPKSVETQIDQLQEATEKAREYFKDTVIEGRKCEEFNEFVLAQCENLDAELFDTLQLLVDVSTDYGDHYIFDNFDDNNLGWDSSEKCIVLLDPMFDMAKIQQFWDHQQAKKYL